MNAPSQAQRADDGMSFFSPEELALMSCADSAEVAEIDADLTALEVRVREMARLVAEGYERERLLRRAVIANKPEPALDAHAEALLDAMKQLADLLAAGATREVLLRRAKPRLDAAPIKTLDGLGS